MPLRAHTHSWALLCVPSGSDPCNLSTAILWAQPLTTPLPTLEPFQSLYPLSVPPGARGVTGPFISPF